MSDPGEFLPYGRQCVDDDDIEAVVRVLRSAYLTTGPEVTRFEEALASEVGARHAVVVSNGTAALHAACDAAGVGPGDEVIVPAVTFVATANCAHYLGARAVFADVDPDTGLVDARSVEGQLSEATKVILPVHLTGALADTPALRALARKADATLIEDAAHALGAGHGAARAGGGLSGADMSIFSFHPVKHITTGEGGAITVDDEDTWRRLKAFCRHGIVRAQERLEAPSPGPWYYEQQLLGHNLAMTDIQAALGASQLAKLGRFVARRRDLAARYDDALRGHPRVRPVTTGARRRSSAYHLYPVLIEFEELGVDRAALMHAMRERGVGTQVHYIPVPMQPFYRRLGHAPERYPGAMRYYARTLSLPLFPTMRDDQIARVVGALDAALSELSATATSS